MSTSADAQGIFDVPSFRPEMAFPCLTEDMINLTPQESQFIELKLALAAGVRQLREQRGMTQAALAGQLGSSQSRVAKMESADRSVTLDLMMRGHCWQLEQLLARSRS